MCPTARRPPRPTRQTSVRSATFPNSLSWRVRQAPGRRQRQRPAQPPSPALALRQSVWRRLAGRFGRGGFNGSAPGVRIPVRNSSILPDKSLSSRCARLTRSSTRRSSRSFVTDFAKATIAMTGSARIASATMPHSMCDHPFYAARTGHICVRHISIRPTSHGVVPARTAPSAHRRHYKCAPGEGKLRGPPLSAESSSATGARTAISAGEIDSTKLARRSGSTARVAQRSPQD